MTLTLYNTLTRRKEPFEPIDPQNVRMYVCGPTVYDLAHIGNARPIIVFDVLFRLLRHIYGEKHVTYARNITDVDDKINARAVERFPDMPPTAAIRKLTEETTAQFHKDIAALGVLPPTFEPRATEYIHRSGDRTDMVRLIEQLIARGHAYIAEDHVLFWADSMPDYGRLSKRSLEEMEAGARVDVAPYKRGPMDFVLWKPSKPGEPSWPSPAGIAVPGRPGWHIECSAMAGAILGDVFDIHGGGIDLVFPHHENEIAQSRCAHGTSVMANYWMHNGFLRVEGEKMSKSLGNFVTINELLDTTNFGGRRWPGEVLRLAMLTTNYTQPIDWTVQLLEETGRRLDRWKLAARGCNLSDLNGEPPHRLVEILSNDLNTNEMIVYLDWLSNQGAPAFAPPSELASALAFLGFMPTRQKALRIIRRGLRIALGAFQRLEDLGVDIDYENYDAELAEIQLLATQFEKHKQYISARVGDSRFIDPEAQPLLTLSQMDRVRAIGLDRLRGLITARLAARKAKDWKESDRIRDELAAMGIQLKDSKNPATGEIETTWEVKR